MIAVNAPAGGQPAPGLPTGQAQRPRLVGYAYPWDVAVHPAEADRYAALGVDTVALAGAYHATRTLTRRDGQLRITELPRSLVHFPRATGSSRLECGPDSTEATAGCPAGEDCLPRAGQALRRAGVASYIWLVAMHNSHLAGRRPDLAMQTAFGQRLPHALCPSQSAVVEHLAGLARDALQAGDTDTLVMEAVGHQGVQHAAAHDKTAFAEFDQASLDLLSVCWCAACRSRYTDQGLDPAALRIHLQAAIGNPPVAAQVQKTEEVSAILRARAAAVSDLVAAVREAVRQVRPGARVILHATADPWSTGPFAPSPGGGAAADVLCAPHLTDIQSAPLDDLDTWRRARSPAALAALVNLWPERRDPAVLTGLLSDARDHGAGELHLYHLGMLPPAREPATRAALLAFRARPPRTQPQSPTFADPSTPNDEVQP